MYSARYRRNKILLVNSFGLLPAVLVFILCEWISDYFAVLLSLGIGIVGYFSMIGWFKKAHCQLIPQSTLIVLLAFSTFRGAADFLSFSVPNILLFSFPLFIISFWAYVMRPDYPVCRKCAEKYGSMNHRGLHDRCNCYEAHYIMGLVLVGAAISFVVTSFYWLFLFDENKETANRFFFYWFPLSLYVLLLVYECIRVVLVYDLLFSTSPNDLRDSHIRDMTSIPVGEDYKHCLVRLIVVNQSALYLSSSHIQNDPYASPSGIDVPVYQSVPFSKRGLDDEAKRLAEEKLHIKNPKIKLLRESCGGNPDKRIAHFLLFLQERTALPELPDARWYEMQELNDTITGKKFYYLFKQEYLYLVRLSRIIWRYDENGYIRFHEGRKFTFNYLYEQNVNLTSGKWFRVSLYNEDKWSFMIREWFKRLRCNCFT